MASMSPICQGPSGRDFFGRYQHFEGTPFADQSRQALRASPASDQAQGRAAMSEDRMWRGDAISASQREIEPASHAVAGNGGTNGAGKQSIAFISVCPNFENS